jgi:hypothetical protein
VLKTTRFIVAINQQERCRIQTGEKAGQRNQYKTAAYPVKIEYSFKWHKKCSFSRTGITTVLEVVVFGKPVIKN